MSVSTGKIGSTCSLYGQVYWPLQFFKCIIYVCRSFKDSRIAAMLKIEYWGFKSRSCEVVKEFLESGRAANTGKKRLKA